MTDDPFPKLPGEMFAWMAPFGREDRFDGGEFLYSVGDRAIDLFFVIKGSIDILENDGRGGHAIIATHGANEFTGELDHLSGRSYCFARKPRFRPRCFA